MRSTIVQSSYTFSVTILLQPNNSTVGLLNKLKLKSGLNFSDKLRLSSTVASFALNMNGVCQLFELMLLKLELYDLITCTCSLRNDVDNLITAAIKAGS